MTDFNIYLKYFYKKSIDTLVGNFLEEQNPHELFEPIWYRIHPSYHKDIHDILKTPYGKEFVDEILPIKISCYKCLQERGCSCFPQSILNK